jgi:hypothetical protein
MLVNNRLIYSSRSSDVPISLFTYLRNILYNAEINKPLLHPLIPLLDAQILKIRTICKV